ncbi:hypothetical protein KGY79_02890 [Candidatus Bipolaricaulota bacterium]|nr:hypothetical protein [Candidatus Bipolaricaulota bacterium]
MPIFETENQRRIEPVKVGLVGVAQGSFSDDKYQVYEDSSKKLDKLSHEWGFDLVSEEELLIENSDAVSATKRMNEAEVDLLIVQNSSFASGDLIPLLAEVNGDLLLWGLPETERDGPLPLNSFCGANMYMNVLQESGRDLPPGSWLYGMPDSDQFQKGFEIAIKSTRTIKNLVGSRVGLIIDPAPGFHGLEFDASRLKEIFGVEIVRFSDYSKFIEEADSFSEDEVEPVAQNFREEASEITCSGNTPEKSARLYMAMNKLAERYGLDAYAPRCWPELQDDYGVWPCSANSQMTEEGLVSACEGDVLGAISMMALYYMEEKPPMIMDLSDVDFSDDTVQFWHCGNAPNSFAYKGEYEETDHFNHPGMGCVRDMVIKPQKATAIRLSRDGSEGFILEGEFLKPEKDSFDGSRGWFGNFAVNGKKVDLAGLVETIMGHGLEHHYTFIPGHVRPVLLRLFDQLGIEALGDKEPLIKG